MACLIGCEILWLYWSLGLMFGSLTSAIVDTHLFQYCWATTKFTFWSLGIWEFILDIRDFLCVLVGLFLSLFSIKPLNALLLGEKIMRSLGLNYKEQGLSSFCYQCFGRSITFAGDCLYRLRFLILQNWCFRPVTTLYYSGFYFFWAVSCLSVTVFHKFLAEISHCQLMLLRQYLGANNLVAS
jgi:hypothetical protein